MRADLRRVIYWVAFFTTLSLAGMFSLIAVFGQLRFDTQNRYQAEFTNVSGLESGNFVRVAGVEVGKVKSVTLRDDGLVDVGFAVDKNIRLTQGVRAAVRYENLVGGRFLALVEGPGSVEVLQPGMVIPTSRTSPALDINALIGGFRPLFRALDPEQVNALTGQLLAVFQGQGGTISSVLAQTSILTSTLADRDTLIGEVISNLDTVLATFAARDDQFSAGLDKFAQLVQGLAERKSDIANGLAYINAGSRSIADLLAQARPPLAEAVHQADRTAGQILADRDYVDNLLKTLPDAYQMMNRQGIYGDFFNFYIWDVVLKLNGKGGQPVFTKVVGQDSGRCTPK
jgi:phospholipid/cholesterol/gamma-HCH transport system substrate-binding protein